MKSFKRIVLPNGLRIILAPQPGNLAATVLVKVEAGSKYETKKISGVSHFLEHLCFKGTKKRPTALAITSELESLGASYNAFTGQEITGYYAQVQSGKLDVVLDVFSDMYLNPIFDSKEIEKEKGVIIEELNMYEDMPMRKVGDVFMELLYGNQPAGWDIGGKKEIIRVLNRDDIVKYRSQHYVAQATTVVVAGSFDEKKVLDAIGKMFAKMPVTKKYPKEKTLDIQKNPAVALKFKESDGLLHAVFLEIQNMIVSQIDDADIFSLQQSGAIRSKRKNIIFRLPYPAGLAHGSILGNRSLEIRDDSVCLL